MRAKEIAVVLVLAAAVSPVLSQATAPAPGPPPTPEEVRAAMGIPSRGLELRGQRDAVGFATTAEQMARAFEASAAPPFPDRLGPAPPPGVAGVLCPHDDYLYAGRVYRAVLPLVTARTVVVIGVFHGYRRFGARDALVFDEYRAWSTPAGPVPVSALREELLAGLPPGMALRSATLHDAEHSVEPLVAWLRHARADLEIVPIIVPAMGWARMEEISGRLAAALAASLERRGWQLGRDVAIAISSDAVHYGADFRHTPFGAGGVAAYEHAYRRDRDLLSATLARGTLPDAARRLYERFVDPERPDEYRLTWCGRFSLPFGMLLVDGTARALGRGAARAVPLAYATSVGWPELPLRETGLGTTAPSNLYHFVGYPGAAFVLPGRR
ncbi:MAG: AmmeMemoRadiSam system protein B [Acidobacteria bacterium]|nr:AmmeMemoRadiSam system protein B [Acidobacteriota bacterium]